MTQGLDRRRRIGHEAPMTPRPHPHDLVVIRHGQTDRNAAQRMQGREDIPLNDTGRAQARRNGAALRAHFAAVGIDPADYDWVASPLSRAAETMRLVREAAGLDPLAYRTDARFVEIDFGHWSGHDGPEIMARWPEAWAERSRDPWHIAPPGGESSAEALMRVEAALADLTRPTVLVIHGGVNRVLNVLLGLLTVSDTRGYHTPQDRFYVWTGEDPVWI
jgi:broad specificity phosphatase PhoE